VVSNNRDSTEEQQDSKYTHTANERSSPAAVTRSRSAGMHFLVSGPEDISGGLGRRSQKANIFLGVSRRGTVCPVVLMLAHTSMGRLYSALALAGVALELLQGANRIPLRVTITRRDGLAPRGKSR
jgi:hypothetical protein